MSFPRCVGIPRPTPGPLAAVPGPVRARVHRGRGPGAGLRGGRARRLPRQGGQVPARHGEAKELAAEGLDSS